MGKVEVNAKGIKNRLKGVKPFRSIAEYIWNGFDAGANTINISYGITDLNNINNLSVEDNGNGIPLDQIANKFKPVLSSEKRDNEVQHTLVHGKNGLGRLTFYHFSQSATWITCYKLGNKYYQYEISVDGSRLDRYEYLDQKEVDDTCKGTKVIFNNIFGLSEVDFTDSILDFLAKEFAWFLEVKKVLGYTININGEPLSYSSLIKDSEDQEIDVNKINFKIKYIRWAKKLNRHFSRIYCVGSDGEFKYSKPTTLNNKGDEFYHSVFIGGEYFDTFKIEKNDGQYDLHNEHNDRSDEFKELVLKINLFLKDKRKPFIVKYAKSLVEDFEKEGIFPSYNSKNKWETLRSEDIKETVRQLYQVDPRIFSNLNTTQKKTFVSFISLIIHSGDIDDIFKILDGVVELSSSEREVFAKQLKATKLSAVIRTIELISDRYKSVEEFKKLVFDPNMYAGEVPHLQKMMEKNYWLIGEEYQLLTAAEPDFEEALRRFTYCLNGEAKKTTINHPDKNKEMDLFLVRQGKRNSQIENIVLELKHPQNVRLGKKHIDQVYDYYQVIKSEARFNASNMCWKFYLIGNEFDGSDFVQSQINNLKNHGESGLAFKGEYKLYVFKWSEIFAEFELKHDFLNQKLKLELGRLASDEHDSADDIVEKNRSSDAPVELLAPAA